MKSFELIDQQGKKVSLQDLRGTIWVASFFFSTCEECNKSTIQELARLQDKFAGWPDVKLVSFSVFPERDTPEQLASFAASMNIDSKRWLLLTGPKNEIYELVQKSFEQSVSERNDAKPGAEVVHTFRFMIVDQHGKIRGYVDGKDRAEVDRLAARVKQLVQAKYLPSINAALNGCSGLLLLLGYFAVRRRWITFHKICMLSALAVSALFLACYLYYHLVIQHGQPTRFGGSGGARVLYFVILATHTVLAAGVAPLALATAYLGLRNKLRGHIFIARWTLPIWLYVSVTGVIVYWMLYHLYPPG